MNLTATSTDRLESFIEIIAEQARTAMHERVEDIRKAWQENIEEAQNNEDKFPPLKLGISACVDLEKNRIETTVRFTATYSSSLSAQLPDPNQPELPEMAGAEAIGRKFRKTLSEGLRPGDSVTMEVNGKAVTVEG